MRVPVDGGWTAVTHLQGMVPSAIRSGGVARISGKQIAQLSTGSVIHILTIA